MKKITCSSDGGVLTAGIILGSTGLSPKQQRD